MAAEALTSLNPSHGFGVTGIESCQIFFIAIG